MRLWFARITSGRPAPVGGHAEHDAVRWLDAASLHDVDWLPGDLRIVAALAALLSPR
jgi:8-oxo-dGTP diphosphatase